MNYLSVCSGVEAATVAWHHLGWKPNGFSEIEKFPSQVLQHHYPETPNFGDMTKFKDWKINESVDLFVGGTPCQSFSVAGLRKGLADPRGNLMLTYLSIAAKYRPRWLVWENVPGVLSSNKGRDFGTFLGALGEIGYGFAYRVLDAQYFGVPQRRRRVFVVGYLGHWTRSAAVLFERESLSGHTPQSKEKRKEVAGTITTRIGNNDPSENFLAYVGNAEGGNRDFPNLTANNGAGISNQTNLVSVYENHPNDSRITEVGETAPTVTSRFGTGGGNVPLVQHRIDPDYLPNVASTLTCELAKQVNNQMINDANSFFFPVSYRSSSFGNYADSTQGGTIRAQGGGGSETLTVTKSAVRRLTPEECELLQGFPKGYTDIKPKGKRTPDAPRYKAMGNSMAVPVMRWIGERIKMVEGLIK